MGIINRLFGFRWSLNIVRDGKVAYALQGHNALNLAGRTMSYFQDGKEPLPPWELYLNFNRTNKTIKLVPAHFSADGENVKPLLIHQISAIDPGWDVGASSPVFVEASTKKQLKVTDVPTTCTPESLQEMFDNINKPREITFYSVMDSVFGKAR